mgnify:CR=1 FL=1
MKTSELGQRAPLHDVTEGPLPEDGAFPEDRFAELVQRHYPGSMITVEGFAELVHPQDRERVSQAIERALEDGLPYEIEFRIVRPDGEIRWIANRARTDYDREGRPIRHFGIALDITERKTVEEALRAGALQIEGDQR